jgi:hypothetical protein
MKYFHSREVVAAYYDFNNVTQVWDALRVYRRDNIRQK